MGSPLHVDLVFSHTAEYGELPGNVAERLEGNVTAQNAARMLKLAFHYSNTTGTQVSKPPAFVLELLALEAQVVRERRLLRQLADGSMQLFSDALQMIVDEPTVLNSVQDQLFHAHEHDGRGMRGRQISAKELRNAQHHAHNLLHVLCASRIYSSAQRFSLLVELERWVRRDGMHFIQTPLGLVPGWLLGLDPDVDKFTVSMHNGGLLYDPQADPPSRVKRSRDQAAMHADSRLFLDGHFGKYTLQGALQKEEAAAHKSVELSCKEAEQLAQNLGTENVVHNKLKSDLREQGNMALRDGRYQQAVQVYTELMQAPDGDAQSRADQHLLLSNRSYAYAKLKDFGAAETDALAAISAKPSWLKGYVRLFRALLGKKDARGALGVLQNARETVSKNDLARDSAALDALEMEARGASSSAGPHRADPSTMKCQWPSVVYKDSVILVDARGSGDFVSLQCAINSQPEGRRTSFLLLQGSYTLSTTVDGKTWQIIGEGKVKLNHDPCISDPWIVRAVGDSTTLHLENLQMDTARRGTEQLSEPQGTHCVIAAIGARVAVSKCTMRATGPICNVHGHGSQLDLKDCETQGPGAAALASEHGMLTAVKSQFKGSQAGCVEVRCGGICRLEDCEIADCDSQGLMIWSGGCEAKL
eukprot:1545921-Rhodomonas_salina.1